MLQKFARAARVSAVFLVTLLFLISLSAFAEQEPAKEGHAPRTKTAQKAERVAASPQGEEDEIGDREHPREREEWFMRGRRFQGRPAPQLLVRAQQQRDQLRREAYKARQLKAAARVLRPQVQSATTNPVWSELGPSPLRSVTTTGDDQDYGLVTGRVTTVAVDQGDPTGNTV